MLKQVDAVGRRSSVPPSIGSCEVETEDQQEERTAGLGVGTQPNTRGKAREEKSLPLDEQRRAGACNESPAAAGGNRK